ncbi:MAG: winged helix DNA-binding protein [Acidobacteria bacterium]|nr:winged helix DNA-binding protein [Acidobacteriota bacterium]
MKVQEELLIGKPLDGTHEVLLSLLLTREAAAFYFDERVFKPSGISDQQFNVLRILRGGPKEGYLVCEIKRRMIHRNADAPRLIERLAKQGLVRRRENPADRRGTRIQITPKGLALAEKVGPVHAAALARVSAALDEPSRQRLVDLLDQVREVFRAGVEAQEG